MGRLDETRIVDRDTEIQRLSRLVGPQAGPRVVVVSHRSGMGKTDLLRKLRLSCERDLEVAVGLVRLEDFESRPDEFAVVSHLARQLARTGAELPHFEELDRARAHGSTATFLEHVRSVRGHVDLTNAAVTGAPRIAAVMVEVQAGGHVSLPDWNPETDAQARSLCVEAFLSDLAAYAGTHPVVLIFDSVDAVGEELRHWILTEVVKARALAAAGMVVVLAGEDAVDMVLGRLPRAQHDQVERIEAFAEWDVPLLREFFHVHGKDGLTDQEIEWLHTGMQIGHPLTTLLTFADELLAKRGR